MNIDKELFKSNFEKIKSRLAEDPFFCSKKLSDEGGSVANLEKVMQNLPETFEDLFYRELQGVSPEYRYAGLLLAKENCKNLNESKEKQSSYTIKEGTIGFLAGDLTIKGNLIIEDGGIGIITGNLNISGNIIGGNYDYTLLAVGGELKTKNLITNGEVIVANSTTVENVVYLYGNDYSMISPEIKTTTLIENNRLNNFGKISAQEHFSEFISQETPEVFHTITSLLNITQVTTIDEFESKLREQLLKD